MKSPIFSRRSFLGLLLLIPVLARCKKDDLGPGGSKSRSKNSTPPIITDDYLAQYGVTECGANLVALDPTFNQSINGYTDLFSYNPGDTVNVYLSGPANENESISLMNTGGETVASVSTPITTQKIKSNKPWVDGFMYDKTFSFQIPANFKSGVYTWMGQIPFICKAPLQATDLTIVYPSNTMNAYNHAGSKSIYAPDDDNRSFVLSFLRSRVMNYPEFYKWIDDQSYSVKYIADSDLDDYSEIDNSKIVVIVGHSEYWTRQARLNIDKFIASGRNVLVLSGNNMWCQIRYDKKQNLMICYKNAGIDKDPLGDTIYGTRSWSDPKLKYSIVDTLGADFTMGGYGDTLPNPCYGYKIVGEKSPLFAGSKLKNGDILKVATREYDGVPLVKRLAPGSTETPIIDHAKLNCYQVELLGYDFAQSTIQEDGHGMGTFIVYKRTESSGTVVNVASMDWAYYLGYEKHQTITKNMIELSLKGDSLFTT
jgi:hypothetical protein